MSELDENRLDLLLATLKASASLTPVTSVLAEALSVAVPGQRLDRVVRFLEKLSERLSGIEFSLKEKLNSPEALELLEETTRQSAKAISDERREYLSILLAGGLKEKDIRYAEHRRLLGILEQLSDTEILVLQSTGKTLGERDLFFKKHPGLEPVVATITATLELRERAVFQEAYRVHLTELGLMEPKYHVDRKTKLPEFGSDGKPRVGYYWPTALGRLLLRHIGLVQTESPRADGTGV